MHNCIIKKITKISLILLCLFSVILVLCYFAIGFLFDSPNNYHASDKIFTIEEGSSLKKLSQKLFDKKIVVNKNLFFYGSLIKNKFHSKILAGEYYIPKKISYQDMLKKFFTGDVYIRKLTIAEGLSAHTIISIINNTEELKGEITTEIEEGSLFPDTYFYKYNDTRMSIVKRMQKKMHENIDNLWNNMKKDNTLKSKKDAIILASIIEKEASNNQEKPLIASVFINRLNRGMKLQADPTIVYSFTQGDRNLERPITKSDIKNNSKFNTYNIYGLPPSPICNPGMESIKSAINPAKTEYLYFVAKSKRGDGHNFSTNLTQHNIYVKKFLKTKLDTKKRR